MDVAHYDAHLARDIERRNAEHDAHQTMRDARRADYDASLDCAPILRFMRDQRVPQSNTSQRAFVPSPPRVHRDTRLEKGPNAWETRAPHMGSHKATDKACHHPLVKCHHKW